MKLCRFELAAAPGYPKSGIVYGGKIYETQGAEGVAIHEVADVRLLAPIGQAPSVRLFGLPPEGAAWNAPGEHPFPAFTYANPASMVGPTDMIQQPDFAKNVIGEPMLGVVIGGAGKDVPPDQADEVILGLSLMWRFKSPTDPGGRGEDIGIVLGPALTTPDELDDAVTVDERGRRYRFTLAVRIGGEEIARYDLSDLPYTLAELVSHASESCPLLQGDLIGIALESEPIPFERGDEKVLTSDKIGLLAARLI